MSKYFRALGYPKEVPKGKGVSYDGFMRLIRKLSASAVGCDEETADQTHSQVEAYMLRGFKTAAAGYARTLYGGQLAGRSVSAWVAEDETVLVELRESVGAIQEATKLVRLLPGRFGGGAKAKALPGFETVAPTAKGSTSQPHLGDGGATPDRGDKGKGAGKPKGKKGGKAPKGGDPPSGKAKDWSHEERLKANPKRIFYFSDGSHSLGCTHINWPKIAVKFGLDAKLCGPVQCNVNVDKPRDYNCMNADHRYAAARAQPLPQTREDRLP